MEKIGEIEPVNVISPYLSLQWVIICSLFCHLAPCSFCLDPLVSFANLLSVFFVILFLLNPFFTFCALYRVFGSSSTSTLLWPEITVRSVWDATAGLLTLWITATTLCLVQFTLGKNSCTLIQPGKMFPSMHTLTVHVKRHTYCMCIHITICRNHTFYMLTGRKCFTVFCSPPKSQYSANSAALMQGCGISAVLLLYTLH